MDGQRTNESDLAGCEGYRDDDVSVRPFPLPANNPITIVLVALLRAPAAAAEPHSSCAPPRAPRCDWQGGPASLLLNQSPDQGRLERLA